MSKTCTCDAMGMCACQCHTGTCLCTWSFSMVDVLNEESPSPAKQSSITRAFLECLANRTPHPQGETTDDQPLLSLPLAVSTEGVWLSFHVTFSKFLTTSLFCWKSLVDSLCLSLSLAFFTPAWVPLCNRPTGQLPPHHTLTRLLTWPKMGHSKYSN